jgi:hypothetical protein
MSVRVECPKCGTDVPVTEVLQSQLLATVRKDLQATLADDRKLLEEREAELTSQLQKLEESEAELQTRISEQLAEERKKLSESLLAQARESVQLELADHEAQLAEARRELEASRKAELEMRRRERELADKAEKLDIVVAQKIEDERAKITSEAQRRSEQLRIEQAEKRKLLDARQAELTTLELELKNSREKLQATVNEQLEKERKQLTETLLAKARDTVQLELADQEAQLAQARKDLQLSRNSELEMRRRERELNDKAERMEIDVERKLEEERTKIRSEALKLAEEKHLLKAAEKEKTINDMKKTIDELKRKSELTSQQLQGEVQEQALEDKLKLAFPLDSIDPVGKGRNGADVGQMVCDPLGQHVGKIIYESKRTKSWNDAWLPKIRDDLRETGADIAVIVTETMPNGVTTFECIDGVWICRWEFAIALAAVLRSGLIDVAAATKAGQGKDTKVELLYGYFASNGFRNRVSGMVEAIHALQLDLVKEKAAVQKLWSRREKQHERAILNISGMYGDFQGIIGESIPALEGFEPLRLELNDSEAA